MIYLIYFVHVAICLFLILVVLLQQGKGADLSVFGGGSTQAAFGARGAATLLHKLTVAFFILFIVTTMSISFFQTGGQRGSVMSGVEVEEAATPATGDQPAPTVPPVDAGQADSEGGDSASGEPETP